MTTDDRALDSALEKLAALDDGEIDALCDAVESGRLTGGDDVEGFASGSSRPLLTKGLDIAGRIMESQEVYLRDGGATTKLPPKDDKGWTVGNILN